MELCMLSTHTIHISVYYSYPLISKHNKYRNTLQIELDALPTAEERKKISREVEMLQQLNHKYILRIRDHWENPQTNQLCFITDILQGGSLRELSIYRILYRVSILHHAFSKWCQRFECQSILNIQYVIHTTNTIDISVKEK